MQDYDDSLSQSPPIWAVFGDLMSALVGVFVLLLVFSLGLQVELSQSLKEEIQKREAEEQRRMALEEALADPLASGRVTFRDGRIGISGSVLFSINSAELQEEGRELLHTLVAPLRVYLDDRDELLMVSGFTDNLAIQKDINNRFSDNWDLSAQRALTVTRALIDEGMPADYVFAAAFGDQSPVAPNDSPEGRKKNRRVEMAPVPRVKISVSGLPTQQSLDNNTAAIGAMPETTQEILQQLSDWDAASFSPVQWRLIEALQIKHASAPAGIQSLLEQRLLSACEQLYKSIQQAQQTDINSPSPANEQASKQTDSDTAHHSPLHVLITELNQQHQTQAADTEIQGLDRDLQEQEQTLLFSLKGEPVSAGTSEADDTPASLPELRAFRYFRASADQRKSQLMIRQAIESSPDNAGPLNPQMLSARSLEAMRELSPAYLNRFLAYIDSLSYLEQLRGNKKPGKKKPGKKK